MALYPMHNLPVSTSVKILAVSREDYHLSLVGGPIGMDTEITREPKISWPSQFAIFARNASLCRMLLPISRVMVD